MNPDDFYITENKIYITENKNNIVVACSALAAKHGGDKDECTAWIPRWLWNQEFSDDEKKAELIYCGSIPVFIDDDAENDYAIVVYAHEGEDKDSMKVELTVPAMEAMGDAAQAS